MSRAREIKKEYDQVSTLESITAAFENIASTHVQQTKDKTLSAKDFFQGLWAVYSQLRADPRERITHAKRKAKLKKDAVLVVTSQKKLAGGIDIRIVEQVLNEVNTEEVDIISVGAHGATLLKERGVQPVKVFRIPEQEGYIGNVNEIINFLEQYQDTTVYYETYISLAVQEVKKIKLLFAVQELSPEEESLDASEEVIHKKNYIFEPSHEEVVSYMEKIMLQVALSQIFLESTLAQHASRFKAMNKANDKAQNMQKELDNAYHREKRAEKDTQIRETINAILFAR